MSIDNIQGLETEGAGVDTCYLQGSFSVVARRREFVEEINNQTPPEDLSS